MSFGAIASRLSGLDAGRHRPSSTTGVIAALTLSSFVKEWIQAGEATPGHSLFVIRLTAENVCRGQKGTQGAPVCESLKG